MTTPSTQHDSAEPQTGWRAWLGRWQRWPLYRRILVALVLGVIAGITLNERAAGLAVVAQLIIRILGALATPLILLAVVKSLMQARVNRHDAIRVGKLLILNTLVAIGFGLLVANLLQAGECSAAAGFIGDCTERSG